MNIYIYIYNDNHDNDSNWLRPTGDPKVTYKHITGAKPAPLPGAWES